MDRRKFIRNLSIGALPIVGGSIIGCESTNDSNPNWGNDYNLLRDIATLEAVAIKTYQAAIDSELLTPNNLTVAQLFQQHHKDHLNAYNGALTDIDWAAKTWMDEEADSRLSTVTNELTALQLALTLEFEAAQFYHSKINEGIETDTIRMLFTNIFPMEVGHVVTFKTALGLDDPNGATGLFDALESGLS
jgi:hypothetical protein